MSHAFTHFSPFTMPNWKYFMQNTHFTVYNQSRVSFFFLRIGNNVRGCGKFNYFAMGEKEKKFPLYLIASKLNRKRDNHALLLNLKCDWIRAEHFSAPYLIRMEKEPQLKAKKAHLNITLSEMRFLERENVMPALCMKMTSKILFNRIIAQN